MFPIYGGERQTAPQYFRWTSVDLDPSYREHKVDENHSNLLAECVVFKFGFGCDWCCCTFAYSRLFLGFLFGLTGATVHQGLIDA